MFSVGKRIFVKILYVDNFKLFNNLKDGVFVMDYINVFGKNIFNKIIHQSTYIYINNSFILKI